MTKRIYIIPLFLSENLEWECDQVIGEKVPTDTKKASNDKCSIIKSQ